MARVTELAELVAARSGRVLTDYADLWRFSVENLAEFWTLVAEYFQVSWHDRPADGAMGTLRASTVSDARWFQGASLNYAEHALRGSSFRADSDVAVLELDEAGHERVVTLGELRAMVGAAEAGLRRLGVGHGDRVAAFAPNRLETLVGFLATSALGGIWSSCAPEFGAHAVADRFQQIDPKVLIVVDGYRYGGREFDVRRAVADIRAALPRLAAVVQIPMLGRAIPDAVAWGALVENQAAPVFETMRFDEPLWVLFSSGTTGLPKAIVQSVGGIVLEHMKTLALHHDLGPGKKFFWFTTTGWMMWNLLIGGLLVGATVVLYDGSPAYPDLAALWRLAADHRIDYVGVSAAFITSCRSAGLSPRNRLDLSCVETVGSTGSPLSGNGFDWVGEHIGQHVKVASLSGGTDVCTEIVGAVPTVPARRGEISVRALGCAVEAYDDAGRSVIGEVGELVITAPMPSMPLRFWGDADGSAMRSAYFERFPGAWRHGDWIRFTERGTCVIEGRSDATLNRGGVRMGTAEFYRVVDDVSGIADSLVVDTSRPSGAGDLLLFVVVAPGADAAAVPDLARTAIRAELSPRHVPGIVLVVPAVPRTLSGKKCEIPVKRILMGTAVEEAISRDALADPVGFDRFLDVLRNSGLLL